MAKPRSGYKRPYPNQAPSGVWIEIKTAETYQKLKACAKANGCTISQWAERSLRYALTGEPYIPSYRHTGPATPTKCERGFRLSDLTYSWVESRAGEDKARAWIGKALLGLAAVELERARGEQVEHAWRERSRI